MINTYILASIITIYSLIQLLLFIYEIFIIYNNYPHNPNHIFMLIEVYLFIVFKSILNLILGLCNFVYGMIMTCCENNDNHLWIRSIKIINRLQILNLSVGLWGIYTYFFTIDTNKYIPNAYQKTLYFEMIFFISTIVLIIFIFINYLYMRLYPDQQPMNAQPINAQPVINQIANPINAANNI